MGETQYEDGAFYWVRKDEDSPWEPAKWWDAEGGLFEGFGPDGLPSSAEGTFEIGPRIGKGPDEGRLLIGEEVLFRTSDRELCELVLAQRARLTRKAPRT